MHQVTHDQPKADRLWILPYRRLCQLRLQIQLLTVSSSFPDYIGLRMGLRPNACDFQMPSNCASWDFVRNFRDADT